MLGATPRQSKAPWYRYSSDLESVRDELEYCDDGDFLIMRGLEPDTYRLLLRYGGRVTPYFIMDDGPSSGVRLSNSNQFFESLLALVEFYQSPQSLGSRTLPCLLSQANSFVVHNMQSPTLPNLKNARVKSPPGPSSRAAVRELRHRKKRLLGELADPAPVPRNSHVYDNDGRSRASSLRSAAGQQYVCSPATRRRPISLHVEFPHPHTSPSWWQLRVPRLQAHRLLLQDRDRAFLIRKSERSDSLVISYLSSGRIYDEYFAHIIEPDGIQIALDRRKDVTFSSLAAFAAYAMRPNTLFGGALHPLSPRLVSTVQPAAAFLNPTILQPHYSEIKDRDPSGQVVTSQSNDTPADTGGHHIVPVVVDVDGPLTLLSTPATSDSVSTHAAEQHVGNFGADEADNIVSALDTTPDLPRPFADGVPPHYYRLDLDRAAAKKMAAQSNTGWFVVHSSSNPKVYAELTFKHPTNGAMTCNIFYDPKTHLFKLGSVPRGYATLPEMLTHASRDTKEAARRSMSKLDSTATRERHSTMTSV